MHIEAYKDFCLQQPKTTASFPFDHNTLVFKVSGKIFTLASIQPFEKINVKCEPQRAIWLREQYKDILPGYHMNKKHWNTLVLSHELTDQQIFQFILDSYNLVVNKLPKHLRPIHQQT